MSKRPSQLAIKADIIAELALALAPPPTVSEGIPGSQTGLTSPFQVVATTVNAGTVTVDTGYKPASGHASKLDGGFSVTDRTAHTAYGKNVNAVFRNYSGTAVAGTPIVSGGTGDGALSTSTLTFSVSGSGTVTVTFTPPGGYVGTLEWLFEPTFTEN